MMRRMRRTTRHRLLSLATLLVAASLLVGAYTLTAAPERNEDHPLSARGADTHADPTEHDFLPGTDPREGLGLDPSRFERDGDRYIQRLPDGRTVLLTLVPAVQEALDNQFKSRKVPYGGAVAIEPSTGRVLAMSSFSAADASVENYALRAQAPSASVFKLISAAAFLEMTNIEASTPVCYSGGSSFLTEKDVLGDSANDRTCADLRDAIGRSLNAVIARLAYYNLSKAQLEEMALRFGYNREIPFELEVDVSEAEFVDDDIERARTAAGFWHVNLSPMHGALIAAAIANDGIMMRPTLVDQIILADGAVAYQASPEPWMVSMSAERARQLSEMSESTTTTGTARRTFAERKDWPKELRVGGKTGTLSNKRPYLLFTWFVGWAPLDNPNIAVGALVANTEKWWIKGTHAAANAILTYHRLRNGE